MSATVSFPSTLVPGHEKGLVRTLFGEYTAASVASNPVDAGRLSLVRQDDGNYALPAFAALASALSRSSASVQASVIGLSLGG